MPVYLESEGIACMQWLAYLPNLNHVENIWDALACTVCKCPPPPQPLSYSQKLLYRRNDIYWTLKWLIISWKVLSHAVNFEGVSEGCSLTSSYENSLLSYSLYIILYFVLCMNIFAIFLPHFMSFNAVLVEFSIFYHCALNFQ